MPFAGTFEQIYARALTAPRPDARSLRPDMPDSLAQLVARCLAADPKMRYRSGVELSEAIEAITLEQSRGSSPQFETSRRGHVRVAYHAPVELKLPDGMVLEGAIQDLSAGGLLVTTNHMMKGDTAVTVRFALPSDIIVVSSAVIRWARSADKDASRVALGVELVDLATRYKQAIADYVRSVEA